MGKSKKAASVIRVIVKMLLWISTLAFLVILVKKNISNSSEFWSASAIDIATIVIAIVISYYLVQKETKKMKQQDIVLSLIERLQAQVESETAYDFTNLSTENILMNKRDMNNKIGILEGAASDFISKQALEFIRKEFNEYDTLIGDHVSDLEYLCKSSKELKRPLDLIANKLIEVSIELYK